MKYAHRGGFIEAEQNKDGSYTISGVSRMSKEQFEQEFIPFPESRRTAKWIFLFNRPVDLTRDGWRDLDPSWGECVENGFECSACKHGAVYMGPKANIDEEHTWSLDDERTPFCPHCGAEMINWNETYEEWKERKK